MIKEFKLEQFNGPLDLLLSLIAEQKLNISEVAISQVTEQYLEYLEGIERKKPEELADFLLLAARLIFLKSRKLLPQFEIEEEEGPSLEEQLRLYQAFLAASKKLNKRWLNEERAVFRIEPLRKIEEFVPAKNVSLGSLRENIEHLLERLEPPKPLPRTHIDRAITVREKIDRIREIIEKSGQMSFSDALKGSENRTEVIVSFLALLELVKQESIVLKQGGSFDDIMLEKV